MSTILITGGAGFIGSHIVDALSKDYEICIIDNLSSGKLSNINKNAKYYQIDINSGDIENIFKNEKPDIVIHLAAQISVALSQQDPIRDATINILGTLKLIQLAKKYSVNKFIAASSAAVYGGLRSPISEVSSPAPLSNYGISKLAMENYIKNSGLNYLILRFSNVYGERQRADGEAGVVTIFEQSMMNNKDIYIHGDGEQIRDFIYVKDIADIVKQLIKENISNEIINVSSAHGLSINNLFNILSNKYNYKKHPIYDGERAGDIKISILDNSKLLSYISAYKFRDFNEYSTVLR